MEPNPTVDRGPLPVEVYSYLPGRRVLVEFEFEGCEGARFTVPAGAKPRLVIRVYPEPGVDDGA